MAALVCSENEIVCISDDSIKVWSIGGDSAQTLKCEKKKQDEEKKKLEGGEEGTDRILASGFSRCGQYFAACDDHKQLTIWKSGLQTWEKLSTRCLSRRGTAVTFSSDGGRVVLADKSGDAWRFPVTGPDGEGELLLGHISMLLDVVLIDDKFLVTADRDEKIRVSHYPNCYNINSFCLGHTDYVSRVQYLQEEKILISGSGDGTVRSWDFLTGGETARVDCLDYLDQDLLDQGSEGGDNPPESLRTAKERIEAHSSTWGQDDSLDLKCLSCCQRYGLLAVGFDNSLPVVQIYKVKKSSERVKIEFLQSLRLEGALWDCRFTESGLLLVLQACEFNTITAYKVNQEQDSFKIEKISEGSDNNNILKTCETINKEWDFFKASLKVASIFPVLHKARIDNMTEYIKRKMERIKQGKQDGSGDAVATPGESKANNGSSTEPDAKRPKTDS